jgi:hypothetical protein
MTNRSTNASMTQVINHATSEAMRVSVANWEAQFRKFHANCSPGPIQAAEKNASDSHDPWTTGKHYGMQARTSQVALGARRGGGQHSGQV